MRIRQLRQQKGLRQQQLAQRAGVTQPHLSAVERGQRQPSLRMLQRIAAVLGCKLDDLVAERDSQD